MSKNWKDYYARQYGEGKVTHARASEEAGVTLWEMMEYLGARKISARYDLSDLRKDLETVATKD